MKNEAKTDKLALFRQSATSMSVGVLFITISLNPTMSYIGFILACISALLLVAAGLQTIQKANKFCNSIRLLGENLTLAFIFASLLTIVLKWASILDASATLTTAIIPNFMQSFFKYAPLIFVVTFSVAFVWVQLSDIKDIKRKLGLWKLVITFGLVIALLGGLYIVFLLPFRYSIALGPKVILLVVWGLSTLGCLYYLFNQKTQLDKPKETQASVENPDMIDPVENTL